jgi:hypothetical protein
MRLISIVLAVVMAAFSTASFSSPVRRTDFVNQLKSERPVIVHPPVKKTKK